MNVASNLVSVVKLSGRLKTCRKSKVAFSRPWGLSSTCCLLGFQGGVLGACQPPWFDQS